MRTLILALLLAVPGLAWAGPCGSPGYNGPLNANTRPATSQAPTTTTAPVTPGINDFGSMRAVNQAYPH